MNNNDSHLGSREVRLFCLLTLKCDLPKSALANLKGKKRAQAAMEAQVEFGEHLAQQLTSLLEAQDIQVAFDSKTGVHPLEDGQPTQLVPFLASKICEFEAKNIIQSKVNTSGFKVEPSAFLSTQKSLLQKIRTALSKNFEIHDLRFDHATSRTFIFEIYYAGDFKVKRVFSAKEIKSEGGVRDTLESFFDEIEQSLEGYGISVMRMASKYRRSRNNEYSFDFTYAPYIGFSESEVHGQGCYSVRGDASLDEVNGYGVDFEDVRKYEAKEYLNASLLDVLIEADLVSSALYYIDDPEEVYDIDDELISP